MNFVIDLAHCGVSVAQSLGHRSAESECLRFDSSWRLRIISLSHARDKTKKHLSLYKYILLKESSFKSWSIFNSFPACAMRPPTNGDLPAMIG